MLPTDHQTSCGRKRTDRLDAPVTEKSTPPWRRHASTFPDLLQETGPETEPCTPCRAPHLPSSPDSDVDRIRLRAKKRIYHRSCLQQQSRRISPWVGVSLHPGRTSASQNFRPTPSLWKTKRDTSHRSDLLGPVQKRHVHPSCPRSRHPIRALHIQHDHAVLVHPPSAQTLNPESLPCAI